MEFTVNFFLITAVLFGAAFPFVYSAQRRSAREVWETLSEPEQESPEAPGEVFSLESELAPAGLITKEQQAVYKAKKKKTSFLLALLSGAIAFALFPYQGIPLLTGIAGGIFVAGLVHHHRLSRRKKAFQRQVEYFLPLVMERIVMSVAAGLDILSALQRVVESQPHRTKKGQALDPVTQLLLVALRLSNSGLDFASSLTFITKHIEIPSLRHAFLHLGTAYTEGGELILPLQELASSTQTFYQESVEEEIAKMPVKATMPLLCTFAGLVLFFLASPLVQILNISSGAG